MPEISLHFSCYYPKNLLSFFGFRLFISGIWSAKDRSAMFQKKSGTEEQKKGTPALKKVGKLGTGGKKDISKKIEPQKKPTLTKKETVGDKKKEAGKTTKTEDTKKGQDTKMEEKKDLNVKGDVKDKKSEEPQKPDPNKELKGKEAIEETTPPIVKKDDKQATSSKEKESSVQNKEEKKENVIKKDPEENKGTVTVSVPSGTETKLSVQVDTDLDLDSELEANISMVSDTEINKTKDKNVVQEQDNKKEAEKPKLQLNKAESAQKEKAPQKPLKPSDAPNVEAGKAIPQKDVKPSDTPKQPSDALAKEAGKVLPKKDAKPSDTPKKEGQPKKTDKEQATKGPKTTPVPIPVQEDVIEASEVEKKALPPQPQLDDQIEEKVPEVSKKESKKLKATESMSEKPKPIEEEIIQVVPGKTTESEPSLKEPVEVTTHAKPKPEVKTIKPMQIFRPSGEDFYNTIFYFSGMGSVVGSSLSKGIFVPDRLTRTSLDLDIVEQLENYKPVEQKRRETVVESARHQAVDLSEELRKLRALLFGLPSWGESSNEVGVESSMERDGIPPPSLAQPPQQPPWKNKGVDLIPQANAPMSQVIPEVAPQLLPKRDDAPARQQQQAPGVNMYGVFPDNIEGKATHGPWQERYGTKGSSGVASPKQFDGGIEVDPKGLKSWQVSRLRGMEAKGYEFKRPTPKTGADYGGDVFSGGRIQDEALEDDIMSYAPFLVSNKTKSVDRKHLFTESDLPVARQIFKPIPPAGGPQLPYCDL